jgi:hypothetical protein
MIYELVAEPPAVAEEIAVDLFVIAVAYAAQCSISFSWYDVTAQAAMEAY